MEFGISVIQIFSELVFSEFLCAVVLVVPLLNSKLLFGRLQYRTNQNLGLVCCSDPLSKYTNLNLWTGYSRCKFVCLFFELPLSLAATLLTLHSKCVVLNWWKKILDREIDLRNVYLIHPSCLMVTSMMVTISMAS